MSSCQDGKQVRFNRRRHRPGERGFNVPSFAAWLRKWCSWQGTPERRRRGLTLLEMMLAIALASVVLYLVSMAIDFHLKSLDTRKQQVEEAQLARIILKHIADDLRCVVYAQSEDSSGGGGGLDGGGGESAEDSGGIDSSSSAISEEGLSLFPTVPGLYGTRYEIQVDVSRLPRVDQYQRIVRADEARGTLHDVVSDVKTVAYYMQEDRGMTRTAADLYDNENNLTGGLYRRELDRAATIWAQESGNLVGLEQCAELLAPEVYALEFRYFDGYEWYEDWDSETFGALPLVVEVVIELGGADTNQNANSTLRDSEGVLYGDHVYRLLVHLPTGEVSSVYDQTETESSSP